MGFDIGNTINNAGNIALNATLAKKSFQEGNVTGSLNHGTQALQSTGNIIGGKVGEGINKATSWVQNTTQQVQGISDFASLFQPQRHQLVKTA